MSAFDLILCLALTLVNFLFAKPVAYKVYNILMARTEFSNSAEKVGFYIHGWLAYAGLMTLVLMPLIAMSYLHGLIGTGFVIILRLLLKGKL